MEMTNKEIPPPSRDEVAEVIQKALKMFGADPDVVDAQGLEAIFGDLNVDSLDLAELSQVLDDKFGVQLSSNDVKNVVTVGDVVDLVAGQRDDGDESKAPAAA
jgi:acyl carrier protein